MAETFKILGQKLPGATTATTLYTVPSKTRTVISTLSTCETGGAGAVFRVHIVPSGGSASTSNAIYYGLSITANDTIMATIGITIGPGDSVVVYSTTANMCFQVFGSEVAQV